MNLRDVVDSMTGAHRALNDSAFRQAGGLINEQRKQARELMQMKTAPEIADIIKRLRAEHDLSSEDLALIRIWLIGDAESYLRAENDFEHWLAEFERLGKVLAEFAGRDFTLPELLEVQGVLEDAARVSLDVANYLEKRERVANFEAIVADPKQINKSVLATILSRKLESDQA